MSYGFLANYPGFLSGRSAMEHVGMDHCGLDVTIPQQLLVGSNACLCRTRQTNFVNRR
jgi:hypothetical protein